MIRCDHNLNVDVCLVLSYFLFYFIFIHVCLLNLSLYLVYFRDNGLKAIENLMEKKGKFDYILLETTGLADPGNKHLLKFEDLSLCLIVDFSDFSLWSE